MEKKEVMVINLNQKVEEMEGARRATGISSTDCFARVSGYNCCSRSRGSGEGNPPELHGGI